MFEIGNTLREARLRRGLDITDCEVATKIRPKYLRALEDEHFDLLPSPAYVRGFLRTYAEYLDLDGQLVIDEYESRYGTMELAEPDTRRTRPAPGTRPATPTPGRRRTRASARRAAGERRNRRRTELQLLWLAVGGVLGVGLLIQMGVGDPNGQRPPLTPQTPTDTTPDVPQDPKLATPEKPESFPVTLSGYGPNGSYVEVRSRNSRGRVLLQTILRDGESKTFRIVDSLWLRTANTDGLRINVDGTDHPVTGGMAEFVVRRTGPVVTSTN